MQVLVGTLMDYFGVKRLMMLALLLCSIGATLFGLNDHIAMAFLGRFLMGLGSAFSFVAVLKLAADWLPYRYFCFFSGLTTTLSMLGAICGEMLLTAPLSFNSAQWWNTMSPIHWRTMPMYSPPFGADGQSFIRKEPDCKGAETIMRRVPFFHAS